MSEGSRQPSKGTDDHNMTKRDDIIAKINVLREERRKITRSVYTRWDKKMAGKLPAERLKIQLHNDGCTPEERKRIIKIDVSIAGYKNILDEGFFQPKLAPKKDEEEEDLLY